MRLLRGFLLVYGLAVAAAGAMYLEHRTTPSSLAAFTMGARRDALTAAFDVERQGGTPLTRNLAPAHGVVATVPFGDFPGYYVYVPALARAAGTDIYSTAKWLFVVAWALMLLSLPLVFYELTGSVLAALAVPLLALWRFWWIVNSDYYWALAWAPLFLLPPLLLMAKQDRRLRLEVVVAVLLLASVADSIRAPAGAPVYAAALVLIAIRARPWRFAIASGLVATVAYFSISAGVMHAVRVERDRTIAAAGQTRHESGTRSFWHTAYIGLGWLPNPYGFRYLDALGAQAAQRIDPKVYLLGPGYDAAVRTAFFRTVRAHPSLFVRNVWQKTRASLNAAFFYYSAVFLLVPLLGLVGRLRRDYRRWLAMLAPGVPLSLISPVAGIPIKTYLEGWFGLAGLLLLLLAGGGIALIEDAVRARRRPRVELKLAWAIPAALFMAVIVGAATAAQDRGLLYARALLHVDPPPLLAGKRPLPLGGTVAVRNAVVDRRRGFELTTDRVRQGYELLFPLVQLPAGSYAVVLRGEIERGGLAIGALDPGPPMRWIAVQDYWYSEPGIRFHAMSLRFDVDRAKPVRIVLSNWGLLDDSRSRWRIRDVTLGRVAG